MYEKRLAGRKLMYFTHAPPLTRLDDYSDGELPKLPFPGAHPWQRSVYYYWWLFLKEHEGYRRCCDESGEGEYSGLYEDFGDVRGDAFLPWWISRGRNLFAIPDLPQIKVVNGPSHEPNEDRILLSVPLTRDFGRLQAELKAILKPVMKVLPGYEVPQPKYAVKAKPVLPALHLRYMVWCERKSNPDLPLHQILDKAEGRDTSGADKDPDMRNQQAIVASRYLREAKCLIEYVGKGLFPITSPVQARL